jgi:glycosyltransferase involved in cell wall biosynthesis
VRPTQESTIVRADVLGEVPTLSVSVIVPVFGTGVDLDELTSRVRLALDGLSHSWELIFVNDGSPPDTWDAIVALARSHSNVRGIDLLRNFGQHNALLAGIRASRGDLVVTMDDDLQHPPEEIPRLLDALGHNDVVYGTPIERVRGRTRDFAAALSKLALGTVLGPRHARDIAAFRLFRGSLRQVFAAYDNPAVSIDVLLSWATSRIVAVGVRYQPRRRGHTGYSTWRLLALTINMVTGFSVWPLRLSSLVGLAFAAFGGFVLAFVLFRYMTAGVAVPGFAFLASVISIFAGAQLFSLGVMGEYLARIYFRTMHKPAYLVKATANLRAPES